MQQNVIDRKFKFVAVNPCNQKVYTEENAVVFCAKDKALIAALLAYLKECQLLGANEEHIESIRLLIKRVDYYQTNIECRVPDTIGNCEIDRCLGGIGAGVANKKEQLKDSLRGPCFKCGGTGVVSKLF